MSTGNRSSLVRRLALSAAAIGLGLTSWGGTPRAVLAAAAAVHASSAASAPPATSSFYVYGSFIDACGPDATTECPLYNDAASEAVPPGGGMTVLDFGAPCFEPATLEWGTQLFNSQSCTADGAVVNMAEAWLRGYEANSNRSNSSSYVLVVGTSNSLTAAVPDNALTTEQMAQHGGAWFASVVTPIAAVAQGLTSHVTIWAGDDVEESSDGNWYDGATTAAWVDAYATVSGATKPCSPAKTALMVDYGDYVPNQPGWSPAAVYHVAWQAPPACPMPEIYNSANAAEWQSLNAYALAAGLPPMQFTGVLSEDGADGSLSSSGAWTSLRSATGQAAPYVSVIGVTGPIRAEVPDAPAAVTAVPGPGPVKLTWTAPAWDGGAAVTAYSVDVYDGSTLAKELTFGGFPAPETVVVPGLTAGTPYTFYVRATNRVGTGPRSLPSETIPCGRRCRS